MKNYILVLFMALTLIAVPLSTIVSSAPPNLCEEKPWLPQCGGERGFKGDDAMADGGIAGAVAMASIGLGHFNSGPNKKFVPESFGHHTVV